MRESQEKKNDTLGEYAQVRFMTHNFLDNNIVFLFNCCEKKCDSRTEYHN